MKNNITSALVVIGNEILSGRTQDKNIHFIAEELGKLGMPLLEVRVIPDIEEKIVSTINEIRRSFTYIFTTGGIGPTHDDITSVAVAKAFGVKLIRNKEAMKMLQSHYTGNDLNEARLKMADIPEGASLIDNPVSKAPGFIIENVYVMAGVPIIMQAMFDSIRNSLKGGQPVISMTVSTDLTEGMFATDLMAIQKKHTEVEIGSYPFIKHGKLGVSLVSRGTDKKAINNVCEEIKNLIKIKGGRILESQG